MNEDRPRAKFPPATWPVPPVRTLRGDAEPVAAPSHAWAAPVRSGLTLDELRRPHVTPSTVTAEPTAGVFSDLEIRAEPLPALEPDLPLADSTIADHEAVPEAEIVPDHHEGEIILNDEVFWIDDLEAVVDAEEAVEGLTALGAVAAPGPDATVQEGPVEGLTPTSDINVPGAPLQATDTPVEGLTATGDTVTPPAADTPVEETPVEGLTTIGEGGVPVNELVAAAPVEGLAPIGDVAIPVLDPPVDDVREDPWGVPARPWPEAASEEPHESAATEWDALGQPLAESLAVPPGEIAEPVEPVDGEEPETDPRELALRLERLADQIRMHGSEALDTAQSGGDSLEAALAKVLAGMVKKDPG